MIPRPVLARVVLLAALLCGCGSKSKVPPPAASASAPASASASAVVEVTPWRVTFVTRLDRNEPVPASDSVTLMLGSDPAMNLIEEHHVKGGRMHNVEPFGVAEDPSRRRELVALLGRIGGRPRTYALGSAKDRRWRCMESVPIRPSDALFDSIVIDEPYSMTKLSFVWDDAAERPPPEVARLLELVFAVVKSASVSCRGQ